MVRIKLSQGPPIQRKTGKNRQAASAFGALLMPIVLLAYVLGVWRLASDLGMAGEFAISGIFSHWQVWIALAAALHIGSASLNRYGRGGSLKGPKLLNFGSPSGDLDKPSVPPKVRVRS